MELTNYVKKIFVNFPLDDIISNSLELEKRITEDREIINSLKKNKIISYINGIVRAKSASYVFIKGIIAKQKKYNYIHDLNLYKNEKLLNQLEINLDGLSKVIPKDKIFFYSIPYAAQVKNDCKTQDDTDKILKRIFNKKNYSILFLKSKFCEYKKPINYYFKKDPVHLSKTGHIIVAKILKKYIN